jgi:ketosteroid isomerase-like protein
MTAQRPKTHRDTVEHMSRENVELVRSLIPPSETDLAALVRDDRAFAAIADALGDLVHPHVECVAVWREGRVYRGVDGMREMWRDWLEPWETYYSELDDLIDADDRVVVFAHDRARLPEVDREVGIIAGSVWELRNGRVTRVEFFRDRAETLAAAGLSEADLNRLRRSRSGT